MRFAGSIAAMVAALLNVAPPQLVPMSGFYAPRQRSPGGRAHRRWRKRRSAGRG